MSAPKVHYDPALTLPAHIDVQIVGTVPLHGTTYAGSVNGIEASNHARSVTCAICLRKMRQTPEKFTTEELAR